MKLKGLILFIDFTNQRFDQPLGRRISIPYYEKGYIPTALRNLAKNGVE
jgi:hypothetical protein